MKKSIMLLTAISTLCLVGCCTTPRATMWEYKQVRAKQSDQTLNQWGEEGWSVVTFATAHEGTDQGDFYILKRLKK